MNILLISASYPPDPGGVATHVADLAHGLIKRGHRITVVTLNKDETRALDGRGKLSIRKLPRRNVPEFNGRRVHCAAILDEILREWHNINPDLVHLHDLDSLFIGWLLKTAYELPIILTVHRAPAPWREQRYREDPKDCFMEAVKKADILSGLVTPSKSSNQVLQQQGFGRNGNSAVLRIIPHGTRAFLAQVADDPEVIKALNLNQARFVVLCPCRADEHKDTEVFIEAAATLQKRRTDVEWQFIVNCQGDDPYYERNVSRARDLGLETGKNIFFQKLLYKQMATVFRRSAACVVPSRHESFGLSVLESFLFRVPVIVANTSGLAELITNRNNGLLFTDGNVDELARQIETIHGDPGLTQMITSTASALVKPGGRFASDAMVDRYAGFYRDVLDGRE